ncbi:hypothetical protein FQN49_005903, partial [Arthroderma sp. PD_2]
DRLRATVSEADVIFCCTPSTKPLFPHSYLRGEEGEGGKPDRRRFVSMIGSYRPHMHEVDADTLLSGQTLLVDSKQACLAEAGELISAGCVGMGIMDLAVGRELLCLAGDKGVGVPIHGF